MLINVRTGDGIRAINCGGQWRQIDETLELPREAVVGGGTRFGWVIKFRCTLSVITVMQDIL